MVKIQKRKSFGARKKKKNRELEDQTVRRLKD